MSSSFLSLSFPHRTKSRARPAFLVCSNFFLDTKHSVPVEIIHAKKGLDQTGRLSLYSFQLGIIMQQEGTDCTEPSACSDDNIAGIPATQKL